MTQVEHFSQIIAQAEEEAERKWLADLPMKEWWEIARDGVVTPILSDAAEALKLSNYGSVQRRKNGDGSELEASNLRVRRTLTFSLSETGVSASSSESSLNEAWDGRLLTASAVTAKVEQFIKIVAAAYPAPASVKV